MIQKLVPNSFVHRQFFWFAGAAAVALFAPSIAMGSKVGIACVFVTVSLALDRLFATRAHKLSTAKAGLKETLRTVLSDQEHTSTQIEEVMQELDSCFERAAWRFTYPAILAAIFGAGLWARFENNLLALIFITLLTYVLYRYFDEHQKGVSERLNTLLSRFTPPLPTTERLL